MGGPNDPGAWMGDFAMSEAAAAAGGGGGAGAETLGRAPSVAAAASDMQVLAISLQFPSCL